MIVRHNGKKVESVEARFDARALNEIAFRRSDAFSEDADAFFDTHEQVSVHELTATASGDVKDDVERELLDELRVKLDTLEADHEGFLLCVESKPGRDYPKTRDRTRTVIVKGENRLTFEYRVEPPLRISVYRKRAG